MLNIEHAFTTGDQKKGILKKNIKTLKYKHQSQNDENLISNK